MFAGCPEISLNYNNGEYSLYTGSTYTAYVGVVGDGASIQYDTEEVRT